MNEQFIEHWRQVAEFDYPALKARLATSEAALLRAEEALEQLGDLVNDYFVRTEEGKG